MRILCASFAGFTLATCTVSEPHDFGPTAQELQREKEGLYIIQVPAGLDTMDFKAQIMLSDWKSIHKLKFPNGGTGTRVLIFDSTYMNQISEKTFSKPIPLVDQSFLMDQEILIDISSFSRGQYYVHYLSCSRGGVFPLIIK